jgi:hypothetical protein
MRTDKLIDFDWGNSSPGKGLPADGFSVRWTGSIRLPKDGKYNFYTISDDGIRLWVDDNLVIDNWTDHSAGENQGQIELWGARPHPIRLEYYENSGAAVAKLLWAGPGFEKQIIPTQFLFPDLWVENSKGSGLRGVYYAGTQLDITSEDTLPPGTREAWARMAKLGRGFGVVAPVGHAVGRADDLAEVRPNAEEGAAAGKDACGHPHHRVRDDQSRQVASAGLRGDRHRLVEPHVHGAQEVGLPDPPAVERRDDARRDVVHVRRRDAEVALAEVARRPVERGLELCPGG